MRGDLVVRIKCTTIRNLEHIKDFLVTCDHLIAQVSCPNSQKTGCPYPQGFQCYMRGRNEKSVQEIMKKFDEFQATHDKPFKKLEINPRSQADKKRDERLSASASEETPTAIPEGQRNMIAQSGVVCESPPEVCPMFKTKNTAVKEAPQKRAVSESEEEIEVMVPDLGIFEEKEFEENWGSQDGYSRQNTETNL